MQLTPATQFLTISSVSLAADTATNTLPLEVMQGRPVKVSDRYGCANEPDPCLAGAYAWAGSFFPCSAQHRRWEHSCSGNESLPRPIGIARSRKPSVSVVVQTSEGGIVLDSGTSAAIFIRGGNLGKAAQISTASGFAAMSVGASSKIRVGDRDFRPKETAFVAANYTGEAGLLPASIF